MNQNPTNKECCRECIGLFSCQNPSCECHQQHPEEVRAWEKLVREEAVVMTQIEAEELVEKGGDSSEFIYFDDLIPLIKEIENQAIARTRAEVVEMGREFIKDRREDIEDNSDDAEQEEERIGILKITEDFMEELFDRLSQESKEKEV